MAPTVQMDDYVMVETTPLVRSCDIVVYRKPAPTGTPEVDYIRRVIALPGDTALGESVALLHTPGHTEGNHSFVAHTPEGLLKLTAERYVYATGAYD